MHKNSACFFARKCVHGGPRYYRICCTPILPHLLYYRCNEHFKSLYNAVYTHSISTLSAYL
jgi:hypothetical protein